MVPVEFGLVNSRGIQWKFYFYHCHCVGSGILCASPALYQQHFFIICPTPFSWFSVRKQTVNGRKTSRGTLEWVWLGFYPVLWGLQGEAISGRSIKCTSPITVAVSHVSLWILRVLEKTSPCFRKDKGRNLLWGTLIPWHLFTEKNHRVIEYQVERDLKDHLVQHHVHKELSYFFW